MAAPGPPDSPPGEESDGIHYFDFSKPYEPTETDPFAAADPTEREAEAGYRDHTQQPSEKPSARAERSPSVYDAFESALEDLPSQPTKASGDEPETTFAPLTTYFGSGAHDTTQRARFVDAFDTARMWSERPFLAVALRMPADAPESAWFPLVEQGIRTALRKDDALLVDRERRKLAAVLLGRGAEAARPLFTNLVAYLGDHIANAAAVSHRISVFTAPNGRPFEDGSRFLTRVYDKP